jgi:hypothetical protein
MKITTTDDTSSEAQTLILLTDLEAARAVKSYGYQP